MNTLWKRLTALGLTLCVSLSVLALPAQAVGTAPALTADHVQYMQGFPNGTFRPNTQLTRAQAAQLVWRLLEDPESGLGDCSYEDVPQDQWYAPAVTALCRLGLFDDGAAFRPNDIITRAEFVDLLVRLQPEASGTADFSDVPGDHWAAAQIGAAVSLGWINGYPNGTFGPEKDLTRAEACTVINRMTGRTGDETLARQVIGLGLYSDVTLGHWAWQTIAEASVSHEGVADGSLEQWGAVDLTALTFSPGIHTVDGALYPRRRFGGTGGQQGIPTVTAKYRSASRRRRIKCAGASAKQSRRLPAADGIRRPLLLNQRRRKGIARMHRRI
ncbi:MAG: S-layer homology domain-containing protein, partial [Ruminiclostridium sp.]|nr:S-layer homology domain-containing protein [Ruminiclostridium sp.]